MTKNREYIERFTVSERIIHILLFTSLIILSITGLTLKFHETSLAQWIIKLEGGVLFRGKIHRFFALILIGVFFYHILTIMVTRRGHEFFQDMLFKRKDLIDCKGLIMYNLGLVKNMPRFGRFTPIQKIQYFAAGVSVVILGLSGFMLWFETIFMMIFPKWVIDLSRIVHSFEATLGFIILIVWHLYNVHLNPQVFPMDKSWLNGLISKEDLRERHPLEYERIYGKDEGA
ncbi:MAG: cytochrome b/b6 domain-containing protein [Syntrophorhabdaceae bacterium]|nr:cytochrome b/b6 domain-containing protein [Syntrophorhabdaceae bacterium]